MQAPSAHCAQSGSAVRSAPFAVAERTTRSLAGALRPLVHVNLDAYCAKHTDYHPARLLALVTSWKSTRVTWYFASALSSGGVS